MMGKNNFFFLSFFISFSSTYFFSFLLGYFLNPCYFTSLLPLFFLFLFLPSFLPFTAWHYLSHTLLFLYTVDIFKKQGSKHLQYYLHSVIYLAASLLLWGPKFSTRAVHLGLVVDKVALGQVSLKSLQLNPVSYHSTNFQYQFSLFYNRFYMNKPQILYWTIWLLYTSRLVSPLDFKNMTISISMWIL